MTLVPLILWAFWIGVYPKPFFDVLSKPVNAIVEQLNPTFFKAPQAATATPVTPASPRLCITVSNAPTGVVR